LWWKEEKVKEGLETSDMGGRRGAYEVTQPDKTGGKDASQLGKNYYLRGGAMGGSPSTKGRKRCLGRRQIRITGRAQC